MAVLDFEDIWTRFRETHDQKIRESLIRHYAYLVRSTVGRLSLNMPATLDREDLIGAGSIGLVRAVDKFDPTVNVKFETYGISLIRGAVMEYLREQDWVPRGIRSEAKQIERAMASAEARLGRPATDAEIAEELETSLDQYYVLLSKTSRTLVVSLDEPLLDTGDGDGIHLGDALADAETDTGVSAVIGERTRRLIEALRKLPPRELAVLGFYFKEGKTYREIGRVLDVSESRAFQLKGQALLRLRSYLDAHAALFTS